MANNDDNINLKVTATDEATPTLKGAVANLTAALQTLNASLLATADAHGKAGGEAKDHADKNVHLAAGIFLLKEAANAAIEGFEAIESQIEKAVEASMAQEKANNLLVGSLVSTGNYSKQAADEMKEYSEQVSKNTGISAAQISTMIAQGVQMGLTTDKAKQLEEASRKLAVTQNIDVQSAFNILKQSLAGHTRALATVIPEITRFGSAQLMQGAAIDLVSSKLTAQYELYQGSFSSAIQKAKGSIEQVYLAFGDILTQNPLVVKGVQLFTDTMLQVADAIKSAGEWITENQATIEAYISAFAKAVEVIGTVITIYTVMTEATKLWAAATKVLFGSMGLLTIAAIALTVILKEYPYLFDYIAAAGKLMLSGLLTIFEGVLQGADAVTSALGIQSETLKNAIDKIDGYRNSLADSAVKSVAAGDAIRTMGTTAVKAHGDAKKAGEDHLKTLSDINAKQKNVVDTYAGFSAGTFEQRKQLAGQAQDRDKALKDFTDYQNNLARIAITSAQEQQMELTKIQANAVKGSGGDAEKQDDANVAVDAEVKKQAALDTQYKKGILDRNEYNQATLASDQRAAMAELQFEQAFAASKAEALGETDAAFAIKLNIEDQRFQLELQQKIQRAQQEQATDLEILAMKEDAFSQHKEKMKNIEYQQTTEIAERDELSWRSIEATQKKMFMDMEKSSTQHLKQMASGYTLMQGVQEGYNKASMALADELIKNEKVSAGKLVGIFLESLGQKLIMDGMGAILQGVVMSILLNPQGPALIAAGGAEIAGGTAIGRLGSSMAGGQADSGMDSVPQPLSGKSFVLSGGERVVQPSANKSLTDFLDTQKSGGGSSGSGTVVNITVNASGASLAKDTVDALVEELRRRSELGNPIINQRGVVT